MYVIFPAEEVVSLTYGYPRPSRPRPRPTLDTLDGRVPCVLPAPGPAPLPASLPGLTTAPPETPRSPPSPPASPTPSLERPPSGGASTSAGGSAPRSDRLKERAKAKLLKKLGKAEDPSFGKISRTPDPDNFDLPAPLATPAFSRKNIFERDFDALFEIAHTPHFGVNVRVKTPEPQRRYDVTATEFPSSVSASSLCLLSPAAAAASLPPRPSSAPTNRTPLQQLRPPTPQRSSFEESPPKPKKVSFFRKLSRAVRSQSAEPDARADKMASLPAACEMVLRELTHPAHNEQLKSNNAVSFKLVKTVSDFASQLSHLYEQHSSELQLLVSSFRKRNSEMRKERSPCPSSLFHTWESLLQEVEADVVGNSNAAHALEHLVARPLLDRTFHVKLQARKLFAHRDGCEAIMSKADDKLAKSRLDCKTAFLAYTANPNPTALAAYYEAHNSYVQQLTATNGMLEQYHRHTLPTILQELEEVHNDLTASVSEAIYQGSEVVANKCTEQHRRYESLCTQARAVSSTADLAHLARALLTQQPAPPRLVRRSFASPHQADLDLPPESMPPVLRCEIVVDRLSTQQARLSFEQLKKDAADLEIQIKQLQDGLESLARIQQRSLESNIFTKVNEIQEEISLKKYDYRAAQLHLAAVRAQKELFAAKAEAGGVGGAGVAADRKLSATSTGSMKNKWLKAFRSLKPPSAAPAPHAPPHDKRNGAAREVARVGGDPDAHNFQEYTYKKITPCDVCSQVLRGHTKQGLRCRLCKMNVHAADCIAQVGKCQTKSRLLRRQKSTSEIESRIQETAFEEEKEAEVDQIYQVLKRANEISKPGVPAPAGAGGEVGKPVFRVSAPDAEAAAAAGVAAPPGGTRTPLPRPTTGLAVSAQPLASSSGGCGDADAGPAGATGVRGAAAVAVSAADAGSATGVRRRLFAGMKSFSMWGSRSRNCSPQHRSISLPESAHRTHCMRNNCNKTYCTVAKYKHKSTPSSPVHSRRLLSARVGRMSSVELPDDHDHCLTSPSTSPCASPVKQLGKAGRLLPANLYVILYNFKSRHQDELDLKAGYKVTVIDTSDPNWWKGKCLGKVGFFPSKYCTKLHAGEKPLQVTHNLQVSDGDNGLMLLRDQIVIQVGDEVDGMVMIRSGDNRQGVCPLKFLQEV